MKIYTKQSLIEELKEIRERGWIPNARHGNDGGVGNTLEDLLEIEENNLPIPNASEWELKCQRFDTGSLTTLIHFEPSPRTIRFVPKILLPMYGWRHKKAGTTYPESEMSFRQTINTLNRSDRGFRIEVNRDERKVVVSFNAQAVSDRHHEWLKEVEKRVGLRELDPQPYWGFDDLLHQIGSKLHNCFYVIADVKRDTDKQLYHYRQIYLLERISLQGILKALDNGDMYADFDARTGHNHGTKFRLVQNKLQELYEVVTEI